MSVGEVLAEADLMLGGAASPFTPDDMTALVSSTNMVFDAGINSTFDQFLAFPASTAPTIPEPST